MNLASGAVGQSGAVGGESEKLNKRVYCLLTCLKATGVSGAVGGEIEDPLLREWIGY